MKMRASKLDAAVVGVTTTVLVILKLTSHIDWSWWWVLAPLWVPPVLGLGLWFVGCVAWVRCKLSRKQGKH